MTFLEQTIVDCANSHLINLKAALALTEEAEREHDFASAWWQLTSLVQLAQFNSGLCKVASDLLQAIDREAAQAMSQANVNPALANRSESHVE